MGEFSYHVIQDFAGLGSAVLKALAAPAALPPSDRTGSARSTGTSSAPSHREQEDRKLLDAYLLAAGMNQIVEDYLHRDVMSLKKVARHVAEIDHPLSPLASATMKWTSAMLQHLRSQSRERGLIHWQREWAALVQRLALQVARQLDCQHVSGETAWKDRGQEPLSAALLRTCQSLLDRTRVFRPALLQSVGRLPACFFTFDQHPADFRRIVESFVSLHPDRSRCLAIVGVRTSGSYLAPLVSAFLRGQGYYNIHVVTWRPGQQWLDDEHRRLTAAVRVRGLALVIDDPPTSGGTLARAAQELLRIGFPERSIVLLLGLFDSPDWWPWRRRLQPYELVSLPWQEWAIHKRLKPEAVQEALTGLLAGRRIKLSPPVGATTEIVVGAVRQVKPLTLASPLDLRARRAVRDCRARGLYRVVLEETGTGRLFQHHVYAKGTGLGYFGDPSLATAQRLYEFFPEAYGARHGLLFRAWLPEEQRIAPKPQDREQIAARIASYVAARRYALAVSEDVSQRLVGRDALWEHCGHFLSQAFGRAAPVARLVLRAFFKRLMRVSHPSLIDGSMAPSQWFLPAEVPRGAAASAATLLKVDFDEGTFPSGTVYCYDAAFDLACAALDHDSPDGFGEFSRKLREAYACLGTQRIPDEQWLLYQLLHLRRRRGFYLYDHRLSRDARHPGPSPLALVQALGAMERDMSRLHERYIGALFCSDVTPLPSGPLCAIDIDGVLETPWLGFPAITPAGALALRAFGRHGYQVALATGRCLDEVRERCCSYRLSGGVAEYGAVVYNHGTGKARRLLSAADEADLNQARHVLMGMDEVYLDPANQYAVRAYRIEDGRRRGLEVETIERVLAKAKAAPRLRPILGRAQTDFVTAGFDKGTGLRALAEELGLGRDRSDGRILALAVGDTASDLPMFGLARQGFAPANADAAVHAAAASGATSLKILKRPYQAGLLLAVSSLLGHHPERCATCRPPCLSADARLLLKILGAQDAGKLGKIKVAIELAAQTTGKERFVG